MSSDHEHTSEQSRKRTRSPSPASSKTSRRRKKACQACRIKKVKCDAGKPVCANCRGASSNCEYYDTEKLTLESATDLLTQRLDGIHNLLEHLQQQQQQQPRSQAYPAQLQHAGSSASRQLDQQREDYDLRPSKDFLQMPAQKTSADAVLSWPVFEGRYSFNTLSDAVFQPHASGEAERLSLRSVDLPSEERIPGLVDKFLKYVHTKNPILDVELLLEQSRKIACEGFNWDAHSCLVLLACALGSIAEPFRFSSHGSTRGDTPPPRATPERALQQGESYFRLASYRLGTLRATLLGVQCYFYAGVYSMYTMRPLLAWQHFIQSSNLYQVYDKLHYGPGGRGGQEPERTDDRVIRLEQCLFCSCFKSESEFRVELPLALTEIGSYSFPEMFPSPPTPKEVVEGEYHETDAVSHANTVMSESGHDNQTDTSLKYQAKNVYNEEESWYYYLTEIALRRIGNRIVNTFFHQEPTAWLNIVPLLRLALEFDAQVSTWSANLPSAMQHWQMTSTIRDPHLGSLLDGSTNPVLQELSWAIENRLLEVRSWLYQPFMFYLIHHEHVPGLCHCSSDASLSPTEMRGEDAMSPLWRLVTAGVECNLAILDSRTQPHRHHGLWFDLRSTVCASLILVGIVKSGHEACIPGGGSVLWGDGADNRSAAIGGKIGRVLAHLDFWSGECPEMVRHKEVLEDVTRGVWTTWMRRQSSPLQVRNILA
ncbi:hypothetical protein ANO11243_055680 [Dothideomycetidae sp. 11243]|nr:hypothetical protein ANO11243_055680 [fungal sp. No.11243]